jgi:hypothetical protein
MAEFLTCPYCNSAVTVPAGMAVGHSVACPRCGDAFTLRRPASSGTDLTSSRTAGLPRAALPGLPPLRHTSNRAVAAVIVAVMACMAAAGLAFALWTVKDRRAHDTAIAQKPRHAPPAVVEPLPPAPPAVAPDKLEALGYLPAQAGLILAAHVADLQASPAGKKLLADGFQVGKTPIRPETLARWTGFKPNEIDHLAVGVRVDDSIPPHLWLVARTKEPYNAGQARAQLQAQRVAGSGDRPVWRAAVPGVPLPLYFLLPDERTVVVSLAPEHLRDVPETPYQELSQLRGTGLRVMIRERREVGSPLWLVAHVSNWPVVLARPLFQGLKKEDLDRLKAVRTLGVWVEPEGADHVKVKAAFHCKDAAAAEVLDEFLQAPRRAANPSLKTSREGEWLSVQLSADLSGAGKLLAAPP